MIQIFFGIKIKANKRKESLRCTFTMVCIEALATEYGLIEEEKELIRNRKWIEMIRRGVIFFVLEKMAAVLGVSNPEVYAAFRGETIEQFQATRKVSMKYSVAGGNKVREIDRQ